MNCNIQTGDPSPVLTRDPPVLEYRLSLKVFYLPVRLVLVTGFWFLALPHLPLSSEESSASCANSASQCSSPVQRAFSSNVSGTGIKGIDFSGCDSDVSCGIMLRAAPNSVEAAQQPALRVQREASYSGGKHGATVDSLWLLTFTSPGGAFYEWPFLSQMYNRSGAKASGGAENVAVAATSIKEFKNGYDYGADQIGPTWGANFVCKDATGVVNPRFSCVALELDNYVKRGAGTDTNQSRVILQLRAGGGSIGDHVGLGIMFGVDNGMVLDQAIKFTSEGSGRYYRGIDFTNAWGGFAGGAIVLSAKNQDKIVWNDVGAGAGSFDSGHGFAIFAGNDNKRYFDNYSNTADYFRGANGDPRLVLSSDTVSVFKRFKISKSYKASELPSCNSDTEDNIVVVVDALAPSYLGKVVGGGDVRLPAFCDGKRWLAH